MHYLEMSSKATTRVNALFRTFFSLWMAFSYLGLALFYPATCDPSGIHTAYTVDAYTGHHVVIDEGTVAWKATGLSQSGALVDDIFVDFGVHQDSTQYIVSNASFNASWLLHSRLPAATTQFFVIDLVAIATLPHAWLNDSPTVLYPRIWLSQFQHQSSVLPLERPPKFLV